MSDIFLHEFIVFAFDHYNPLGVIRTLGENGISPIFIGVKHRVDLGIKSKYLKKYYSVSTVEEGYEILLKLIDSFPNKPFLITCDDKTLGFLDERYSQIKDKVITFNAGLDNRINTFMDKKNVLDIAKKHGLNVLETAVVSHGHIPADISYPIITKSISPNAGGWKSDVFICENQQDLEHAYEKIRSPIVLLQKFINKKNEFCIDGFSYNNGKNSFFGIASTYKYLIPGYYSPYMDVFNFDENSKIGKSLKAMMKEIGFEGIFSIEFLIDENNEFYFCEINFRNSTWSYASTVCGMPLAILWAKSMLDSNYNPKQTMIPKDFTAMVEPVDYKKRNELKLDSSKQWLSDFKKCNCPFYYGKGDDLEPFYQMLKNWDKLG